MQSGHLYPTRGMAAVCRFALVAAALLLFTDISTSAISPAESDEVKDLIKQALKLTRNGRVDEAVTALRRARDLDPVRSDTQVELAFVLTKQRKLGEAYKLVFPVAQAEPKNSRAFAVLGATLLAAGRFHEARLVFFNAIRLNRREHLAWAGYGLLDFYENNIIESYQNLREAVYHKSDEPDYLFALAQIAARAEQYGEAADAYNDFLKVSGPADADRRARIKGLINFLRFLGQSGKLYVSSDKDQTTVPFELIGNRPIINLKINDHEQPLKFVLDTGSGISVVSEETAKRLKIRSVTRGGHARGIGGDGKFEIVYGLLRKVRIGDVDVRNVPVYLRKFHNETHRIDGYIGLALISKFLTTIDYGSQTFSLTRKEAETRQFREDEGLSLPLRLTSSGFLSGEVTLQGLAAPLNFIVDTGASVSVISDRVASDGAISKFENEERLRVIGSAGVTDNVPSYMLPKVTFGPHTRSKIMAVALDLDIINEASGFEQSGILGGNFLKNYRMTFDFRNSKVTFVSVKPENE